MSNAALAELNLAAAITLHASLRDAPAPVRASAARAVLSARADLARVRAERAMSITVQVQS